MNRRLFTAALAGFAAARTSQPADTDRRTRFYTLEAFRLKAGSKIHSGPTMVLEAVIAPHVPHLVLLNGYSSVEEIWNVAEPPFTLLEAAADSRHETPSYFELRVYHSPGPDLRIFHRTGIFPVLHGANTYLIPFDSLAARGKAWDAFSADPEWIEIRKESIDKSVKEIGIYRVTPYPGGRIFEMSL